MTPELKTIVKTSGEIVRMAELKEGDHFDVYMKDDNGIEQHEGRWIADEDGYTQTETNNFGPEFVGMGAVIAHKENA